jgi:putative RecB family exonuclease
MQISYSQINTYQFCPHKYQLHSVEKIPVPPGGNLLLGSAVHAALKFLHDPGRLAEPTLEEVLDSYSRAWPEALHLSEEERSRLFAAGLDMLRRHYQREDREETGRRTATVEHPFRLPLKAEHTLMGRIDRVNVLEDGTIELVDYKTSRTLPAQNDIDNDRQLAIYRLAAERLLYPGRKITSSLYYLQHGLTFTANPAGDLTERVEEEIHWVIGNILAEEFSPRPKKASFCDYCEYHNYCQIFRPVAAEGENQSDMESLVRELAEISSILKDRNGEIKRHQARKGLLEKELLAWFKQMGTGCCQAGGVQAMADVIRRVSFPAEEVRKLLEPQGNWELIGEKLTVSKTALEELFRTRKLPPALQYQLLALGVATDKPTVKLRAVGQEDKEEDEV